MFVARWPPGCVDVLDLVKQPAFTLGSTANGYRFLRVQGPVLGYEPLLLEVAQGRRGVL